MRYSSVTDATDQRAAPSSGNVVAVTAAVIGAVSAFLSSTLGVSHAKRLYDAARGGTAGFEDYIDVGRAFWDVVPIGLMFAVTAGLLTARVQLTAVYLRFGAAAVGAVGLWVGAAVDPARHLDRFLAITASSAHDTPSFLGACYLAYGGASCILAAIAGVGLGVAAVLFAREHL